LWLAIAGAAVVGLLVVLAGGSGDWVPAGHAQAVRAAVIAARPAVSPFARSASPFAPGASSLAASRTMLPALPTKLAGPRPARSARAAGSAAPSLHASYRPTSVRLLGPGWSGLVGLGEIGRAGGLAPVAGVLDRRPGGARYRASGVDESFAEEPTGVEQSFTVSKRAAGTGSLLIEIGLTGLRASGAGRTLLLRDGTGRPVGSYSGLHVTDAADRVVPATMRPSAGGRSIVIDVTDRHARYPLQIDPIFGELAETPDPGTSSNDQFGYSVAVSGSTAVVGAPGSSQAYVYSIADNTWNLMATLNTPNRSTTDLFGQSVAISGSTIVIGDPGQLESFPLQGAAYVYAPSGNTWGLAATLTASDGALDDRFGSSVAISGSTIIAGAPDHNGSQGAVYVYNFSGGSAAQTGELTPSDPGPSDELGSSVGISADGSTVVAGAISGSNTGTAYVYTLSAGIWTQAPRIALPVSDANFLPATVAVSDDGSTVVVGDQYSNNNAGAAYVYTVSGGVWSLATTLIPADGGGYFGRAIAMSGNTMVVGAFGRGGDQGAAYVFNGAGSSWTQQATDLTAADGAASDDLGFSVAISGNQIVSGAYQHGGGGEAYLFGPEVQPGPVFTVTNAQDSEDPACYVGDCDLRDAINAANAQPEGATTYQIKFDISGTGVQTIQPATPLPAITVPVVIDGTTQTGYTGSPVIALEGSGCDVGCDGLDVDSAQSTILGLAVDGFPANGIVLSGGGDSVLQQDWIGWCPTGTSVLASTACTLGPGFDGNGLNGIEIHGSPGNQIGGSTTQDTVVAAGNGASAPGSSADILVMDSDSFGNVVANDWISVGADGVTPSGDGNGVMIENGASDNTIGAAGTPNLIYGFTQDGVLLDSAGVGNVVAGNQIGNDLNGQISAIPGGPEGTGIGVNLSPGNVIGDDAAPGTQADVGQGNVLVGETGDAGIDITSDDTTVAGNFVGTDSDGTTGIGDNEGILVDSGTGNVIGPGNTVADNSGTGVEINSSGNRVTANSIHDNAEGGLSAPPSPITDLAAPVLPASSPQSGSTTVLNGTVTGTAGASVAVELFDTPSCDSQGAGTTYLGSSTVTIGANGTAPVSVASATPALGDTITATATNTLTGDTTPSTSAFSNCSTVASGPDNDAWTRAQAIDLNTSADGSASGSIDASGQARWYKVPVTPGGTVQVDLTNLPANYDLALFSDISQAEQSLNSTSDLQTLEAETPGNAFSPSVFSPSVFSPSVFSPSVFSPSVFSPSVFSPSVFSPSVFSPSVFSPSVFSPSVFSPSVFSPSVFSPSVFSPSVFSPSVFSPSVAIPDPQDYEEAQDQSLLGVSDNPGTANQHVYADVWNNTGYFYIRVNGTNGSYDPGADFSLSVEENSGPCLGVAPSTAPLLDSSFTVPGASYQTLILTDESRMTDDGKLSQMESDLQTFAGLPSVNGTIVDVGAISPQVAALESQADQHPDCPYAENLAADAIRSVVSAVRADNSGLKYIVIVGDDHVIPFFRYPDNAGIGPESGYVPPVLDSSPSYASLESNDFLSEDAYGATTVLDLQGVDVPIPDLPVGRLVETPTEIDGMLQAYTGLSGGVVATPTSSLVTGYDFMTRGADAVESDVQAGLGTGATNDTLITNDGVAPSDTGDPPDQSWTADQLRTALLSKRHDLIYLAGHFSANNTLAADYSTTMNATELADSSVNLKNSIVFSAGCHSGYNIVGGDAVPGVTQSLDWAGAFAQKQATLIAGTGYQYGDTDFLAYSEQLYADFSHALRYGSGPVAVGSALTEAKNTYLDDTQNVQGIDVKSLLEPTLYGLPMLSVNLPAGRIAQPTSSSLVGSTTTETSDPGATLGLSSTDLTLSPSLTTETAQLESPTGGAAPVATYLSGPDGVSTSPGAPTEPLAVNDVSVPGQVLRGVGLMGGTYSDQSGITPLTGAPATELSAVHSTFTSSAFFPSKVWSVNYFGGLNGGPADTRLMLTPAQYESDASGSLTDTQRAYSSVGLRLFYSANTATYGSNTPALAAPPTIQQVAASQTGDTVTFQTHVVGDPSAGIQQAWVTYTGVDTPSNGTGEWESVQLTQDATDSSLWTGTISGLNSTQLAALRFVVQAVNGVGLVSLDDNQGSYYQLGQISGGLQTSQTLAATTLTLDSPPASGDYGSSLPVSATLTDDGAPVANEPVTFTIGGSTVQAVTDSNGVAQGQIQLEDDPGSSYQLSAEFDGDATLAATSASTSSFTVNKLTTTLALSGPSSANAGADTGIDATLQSGGVGLMDYAVAFVLTPAGGGTPVVQTATTAVGGLAALGEVPALSPGSYSVQAFFGPGAPIGLLSDPVFDSSQTTAPFTLTVKGQPPAIQSANAASFTIGTRGSFTVTTTGIPTNTISNISSSGCTKSAALPQGVTLTDNHNNTATLAGTPAAGTQGGYTLCLSASNGVGTAATQTFTLTVAQPAPTTPTISNLPASGTYGGSFTATVATNGDGTRSVTSSTTSVCVASGTRISFVGVGTCRLTAQVSQGTTYAAAVGNSQSFSVGAAPLMITASSPSMTYGGAVPAITPSYQGLVGGDTPASLQRAPSCVTSATSTSSPGTYPTSCSGAVDADYKITYVAGQLTIAQAPTTLTYTGPETASTNSTFVPAASLSSGASTCQTGQSIAFTLNVNPITGAAGPYTLESARTTAAGVATGAAISTAKWLSGSYTITATYGGNTGCVGSVANVALSVTQPGLATWGWGLYTVPGAGKVTFAFAAWLAPHSQTTYVGGLSLVNDRRWQLLASVSTYSKSSSTTASLSGKGNLYWWNPTLNHSIGGWALAASNVSYVVTYSATSKTSPGTLGVTISYTPAKGQPTPLPNSAPITLTTGHIALS
jgi:MBG domain (YGX type)/FG-GAP repeat/Bacterial Ig-like domain (group 3)